MLNKYEDLLADNFELTQLKNNFNAAKEKAQNKLLELQNSINARRRQNNDYVRKGINKKMLGCIDKALKQTFSSERIP